MTFEVQQTRWDRVIRRVSGSIGPGSRVGETLPELFPVLDVENLQPELYLLGGTLLAMGSSTLTAGGGLTANIGIFNPAGSGKLITVTRAWVFISNSVSILWSTNHTAFTTLVTDTISRDTRVPLPELPVGQIREETAAAAITPNGRALVPANETFILSDDNGIAVLAPGTGFAIGSENFIVTLTASFMWKERVAEQSELSL